MALSVIDTVSDDMIILLFLSPNFNLFCLFEGFHSLCHIVLEN